MNERKKREPSCVGAVRRRVSLEWTSKVIDCTPVAQSDAGIQVQSVIPKWTYQQWWEDGQRRRRWVKPMKRSSGLTVCPIFANWTTTTTLDYRLHRVTTTTITVVTAANCKRQQRRCWLLQLAANRIDSRFVWRVDSSPCLRPSIRTQATSAVVATMSLPLVAVTCRWHRQSIVASVNRAKVKAKTARTATLAMANQSWQWAIDNIIIITNNDADQSVDSIPSEKTKMDTATTTTTTTLILQQRRRLFRHLRGHFCKRIDLNRLLKNIRSLLLLSHFILISFLSLFRCLFFFLCWKCRLLHCYGWWVSV